MTSVDQLKDCHQGLSLRQILFQGPSPASLLLLRDLGETVAGKVHQSPVSVHQIVVQQASFSRSVAGVSDPLTTSQFVDKRAFPNVRTAHQSELWFAVQVGTKTQVGRAENELDLR